VAGALVPSSDEFGLVVNAVGEKPEEVTTIWQAVGEPHFDELNKNQKKAHHEP
jgi:transcription termination factor Rho